MAVLMPAEERERFLKLYQRCGVEANVLVSLGRTPADLERTIKQCPTFSEDLEFARQIRCAAIEAEIDRRAIQGWEEPVFYHGDVCGTVRRFSDPLLLALARRNIAAYRESVRVDQTHSGTVQVEHGLEQLRLLSPEAQEKLREIILEVEGRAVPLLPPGSQAEATDATVTSEASDGEPQGEGPGHPALP